MKQQELFSYTYDFISQLLDNKIIFDSIKRIILFGSVARGEAGKESDVDLFIDLKPLREAKKEKEIRELIKKEINKFEARCEKNWFLRGIDLPMKAIIGNLDQKKWKELREEILSYGKIIYGNFEERPERLEHKILIEYNIKNLSQKNKMGFLRRLYGYALKKGSKEYIRKGLIEPKGEEKIRTNSLLIKLENLKEIKGLLKKYKIRYKSKDIWLK